MADFWGGLGNAIGTFGKGVGQILTGNWGGAWETAKQNPYSSPKPAPRPTTPTNTGSTGGGRDYAKELQDALARLAAAQKPYVYTPPPVRVFRYDTDQGLAKAKEMAGNALNPVYQQAMNNFLNRQATELSNKQAAIGLEREGLATQEARTLEDTGISRRRTAEDTGSAIAEERTQRGIAAREEGLDFDTAYRALTEGLGAGGMADSGLGRQQVEEATAKMTRMSNEEVRQSENKVAAANVMMNRTFEDLALKDTRAKEDTVAGNKKLDLDINTFIDNQNLEKTEFTFQQEKEKAQYLAQLTKNYQDQLVSQWIQSLYAQGATGQEIQLASQTYR